MNEQRSKGIDSPMCKICGHRHRFADPHVFGKAQPNRVLVKRDSAGPKSVDAALAKAKAIIADPPQPKGMGMGKKAKRKASSRKPS